MSGGNVVDMAAERTARGGLRFDPTINLGHILTFVAMTVGLMTSYSILDKRVGVLEEKSNTAGVQSAERQQEQKEALREIKADIKELQHSVNEIGRTVSGMRGIK